MRELSIGLCCEPTGAANDGLFGLRRLSRHAFSQSGAAPAHAVPDRARPDPVANRVKGGRELYAPELGLRVHAKLNTVLIG